MLFHEVKLVRFRQEFHRMWMYNLRSHFFRLVLVAIFDDPIFSANFGDKIFKTYSATVVTSYQYGDGKSDRDHRYALDPGAFTKTIIEQNNHKHKALRLRGNSKHFKVIMIWLTCYSTMRLVS